jgi:hypothetical protein
MAARGRGSATEQGSTFMKSLHVSFVAAATQGGGTFATQGGGMF